MASCEHKWVGARNTTECALCGMDRYGRTHAIQLEADRDAWKAKWEELEMSRAFCCSKNEGLVEAATCFQFGPNSVQRSARAFPGSAIGGWAVWDSNDDRLSEDFEGLAEAIARAKKLAGVK